MQARFKLYFRVDGNNKIGYGHLFRCLALAEMVQNDFTPIFLVQNSNDFVLNQIKINHFDFIKIKTFESLEQEAQFIKQTYINTSSILLIDGYQFSSNYQKILKDGGAKLICIDDLHNIHFFADIVINQAAKVSETLYLKEKDTRLCIGYEWVLQRFPFRQSAIEKRTIESNSTAFFTLGGSNIAGIAPKIFKALQNVCQINKIVFLKGSQELFDNEIAPLVKDIKKEIEIFEKLGSVDLCNLLKKCDIAICPASVIALECCSVGIGLFTGITQITNQITIWV